MRGVSLDLDASAFGIPKRAWIVALGFAALAVVAACVVPGPLARGCLDEKMCRIYVQPPLLAAFAVLACGAAVSTWVGAISRSWVVGWCAALAGLAIPALLLASMIAPTSPYWPSVSPTGVRVVVIGGLMCFCVVWALQIPFALVATMIPSPWAPRFATTAVLRDDRTHWQREIDAALAVISRDRGGSLTTSESQIVAELVFTLENDPETPTTVLNRMAAVRSLLSSDRDHDARRRVRAELELAATAMPGAGPYRDRV